MPHFAHALTDIESRAQAAEFLRDVLRGLRSHPKRLPCKYFYDRRGSELFDRICELDEYYLTRTELAIMRRSAAEMAEHLGPACMVIELGSGSSTKTRRLLDHLPRPAVYVPVDISRDHLLHAAGQIAAEYPDLEVRPLCADFAGPFDPPRCETPVVRRVVYFPGSTIGNFEPREAAVLLRGIANLAGRGGGLLIGIDLHKDTATLEAAYNDSQGVTAAFNLNLLQRINRELGGTFPVEQFQHRATYNESRGRIEMHLISRDDQEIAIGDACIHLRRGEAICTEYSHKYRLASFQQMAQQAGLSPRQVWMDSGERFAVVYFTVA